MTDERDDLFKIFDAITDTDALWGELKFTRRKLPNNKVRLTILATDQYDNQYTYQEDF